MFRYKLFSPIRLLLPVGLASFCIPFLFPDELINYIWFPIFYLVGSYTFFINFPSLVENIHAEPLYLKDLIIEAENRNNDIIKFKKVYVIVMTFILSVLVSGFSEYIISKGITGKPVFELLGIIGGNIGIYFKAQNIVGKVLLKFFYFLKQKEVRKRSLSDTDTLEDEL